MREHLTPQFTTTLLTACALCLGGPLAAQDETKPISAEPLASLNCDPETRIEVGAILQSLKPEITHV